MKKVREFPEKIKLVVKDDKNNNVTIELKKRVTGKALAGVSQKTMYEGNDGSIYFVKAQKPRSIINIVGSKSPHVKEAFKKSAELGEKIGLGMDEYTGKPIIRGSDKESKIQFVSAEQEKTLVGKLEETEQAAYWEYRKEIEKAAEHVIEMLIERSFLESLSPLIVQALMGDTICVPKNYLFLTAERDALILSKSVTEPGTELVEFLSQREIVKGKHKPEDWKELPKTADLDLTPDEAYILGQLYATGVLIGHWDLFNNIDLSNSGYVQSASGKQAAIIDHGNDFFTGFEGGLKEQSAAENPDMMEPDFKDFKQIFDTSKQLTGKQFTGIFDTEISLLEMPRSLVPDLYNLLGEGEDDEQKAMRAHQLKGFKDACDQAGKNLSEIKKSIPAAIAKMFIQFMSSKDASIVKGVIPKEIYHLKAGDDRTYNFSNIMHGRVCSLQKILKELLKQGASLSVVSKAQFKAMHSSQRLFSPKAKASLDSPVIPQERDKSFGA